MKDSTGSTTTTYDALDRRSSVTNPANKTITYAYNAVGNRASLTAPDGGRTSYVYNAVGQITRLSNPHGQTTSFAYDAGGRRTLKHSANGTRASFTHDAADHLTVVANMQSDSAYISRFDYQYDAAGNRQGVMEVDGSRVTWVYDRTNQLLAERRWGTSSYINTFAYDPAGNRTLKNADGTRTTFTYDAANQLDTSIDPTGTTTYTFDPNGNQQLVVAPNGDRTTNTWDYENKNTKVELPAGVINTLTYNADGLRVTVENSAGTSNILWDGKQYLAESDGLGNIIVCYTNEPDEFTNLISQSTATASLFYHYDALGSTRQVSNAAELVTDSFLFDAWGNEVAHTGTSRIPFRFVGRHGYYYDPDTGNFYIIERILDPVTARWTSVDPATTPILSQYIRSLFSYASSNPATRFDPSGLLSQKTAVQTIFIVIAGGPTLVYKNKIVVLGNCGHYVWRTEWVLQKPAENDGFIIQLVQRRQNIRRCKSATNTLNQGDSSCKNRRTCRQHDYFELWSVESGQVKPVNDDIFDTFGHLGWKHECKENRIKKGTRGTITQTGTAQFISGNKRAMSQVRSLFHGPPKGVQSACNLPSVCWTISFQRKLNNLIRNNNLRTTRETKKKVVRSWDCCDCPCPDKGTLKCDIGGASECD